MKKIYLFVTILLSLFPFVTSAIVIKINSYDANLKGDSPSYQINSNSGLIKKTSHFLVDPTINPTTSSTSICEGDNLTLTANPSGGVAPYTFFWTGPNGFVSSIENPVINNVSVANAGTYSLYITDALSVTSTTQSTAAVIVNAKIDPEFDATLPAICKDGIAPLLSNTSTNGITGTWNPPVVSNTATTAYLFTPNVGQCANSLSFTIFVVNNVTPKFTLPASICLNQTPPILPNVSNNGIVGTWSPATVSNTSSGTYTFTPSSIQCALPATVQIIVNPLQAIFTPAIPPICSGDFLADLPTTSNNGVTGTWSPAMNNTATTTYTFTPTVGQCTVTDANMTIIVNPNVIPTFTAIAPICSGSTSPVLPTTSNNLITGSWSPATVSNIVSATYTFTPTAGQCALPTTLDVTITPKIIPSFDPIADVCYGSAAPSLPTTSTNGITGTWNPATVSNTTSGTYTFTPDDGQCSPTVTLNVTVNQIVTASFTLIDTICSGTTSPILPLTSNNLITGTWNPATVSNIASGTYTFTPNAGQCAIGTTLNVTVTPNVTPTFTAIDPICSGSTRPVLPTTSSNSITGTWNPSTVSNTASGTYTFTPTAGQCALVTTMSIIVYQSPTDIAFTTTDVVNDGPDGIIEITGVTSGVAPFQYRINSGSFTADTSYSGLLPGNYTITVRDSNGCEFNKAAKINSLCLFPNAITPNNDSFNDTFNLKGCDVVKLELYNRYGVEVNRYNNYSDQWDGTNDNGESLPDGTYFYIAEIKDGTSKAGWVFVTR